MRRPVTNDIDFTIKRLAPPVFDSPIADVARGSGETPSFVDDSDQILLDDSAPGEGTEDRPTVELAGPRRRILFDPAKTRIGIVTCGGLCPGINDVIRGLVLQAWHRYGVHRIHGFRYGLRGLIPDYGHDVMALTPTEVSSIHEDGGSILGSSRGPQDISRIVDRLAEMSINILFLIGGDGSLRAGLAIAGEIDRRGLQIALVGLPKTIDNDIQFIDRSFGFETAYSIAVEAIRGAHNEAIGTLNGIGLVKVMGRHSGFLACSAALATGHVNFTLIPEVPIGPNGDKVLLEALRKRLERRRHAVILVAEGFGQEFLHADPAKTDASGNVKLEDIGSFLAQGISAYFNGLGMPFTLKYIDPSYMVRSVPACPSDSIYCWQLAQNAVHAAMCGKTELIVADWHGRLVHVPIRQAISRQKQVDTTGDLWLSVLESMDQPAVIGE
ncbi:MAG: ATP-dependent 6-phosphofructokinase [Planctomycetota bacterium]|jgi:6-phosphofructokinase 1